MVSFEEVKEKVESLGYKVELKNNGVQFYIKCRKGAVNYYPKRNIWVDDKNKPRTGLNAMIKYLKDNADDLQLVSRMSLREYLCMSAIEWVFSNIYLVEEYGFKTWAELYDYIIDNNIEELYTTEGDKVYMVSDYEGSYLPSVLREAYSDIEYVVTGIKAFNVDF